MTAEAAVLNLSAIALAADSAATYGDKIYSTDKLFTLSKFHPVGVMIYGNAAFCGIPFETLIKMHRKERSDAAESHLRDYARCMREFLGKDWICTELQQKRFVFGLACSFLERLSREIGEKTSALPASKKNAAIRRAILAALQALKALDTLECMKDIAADQVSALYLAQLNGAVDRSFDGQKVSDANRKALVEIGANLCIKAVISPAHSGLVVAGFGNEDIFPRVAEIVIDGALCGRVRWQAGRTAELGVDENSPQARIMPFAQNDMMWRFVEGVDNVYQNFIDQSVRKMLGKFAAGIVSKYVDVPSDQKQRILKKVAQAVETAHNEFRSDAVAFRQRSFVSPITNALVSLPKDELADLAEALVSLTSLKRRMSFTERETVGGPVDVAVISKGDGFVWVKRKHYFLPELNPHFGANYFK